MSGFRFFLLFLAFNNALAGIYSDLFIDFKGTNAGTLVNTTVATNATHIGTPNYGWIQSRTDSGFTNMAVWNLTIPPVSTVTCQGTNYSSVANEFSWVVTNDIPTNYVQLEFGNSIIGNTQAEASIGFFFGGESAGTFIEFTAIGFKGNSDYAMLDYNEGSAGNPPSLYIETIAASGNHVTINSNMTYWCSIHFKTNSTSTLRIYNTNDWSLVGVSTSTSSGAWMTDIPIGRQDNHQIAQKTRMWFSHVIVDWTTHPDPLMPFLPSTVLTGGSVLRNAVLQ